MNVLILAAGNSAATNADGYPLCLSEVMGKPLIQVMLEKWQGLEVHFFIMFNGADVQKYHLNQVVEQVSPQAQLISIYSAIKSLLIWRKARPSMTSIPMWMEKKSPFGILESCYPCQSGKPWPIS